MKKNKMTENEQLTAIVYGNTFALYDEATFDQFLAPLQQRLKANGIPLSAFAGKRCFDAGCGGGRGSILMAQAGAAEVVGMDLSATNIRSCRARAKQKRLANARFVQHSLIDIPYADESFDVVWCNGVLHHTVDPDRGLCEITRILKKGGHLWLYLYGSGGVYWRIMDWIRRLLHDLDVRQCITLLRLMDMPVPRIAEWMDDWFVPVLQRYTVADVERRLVELGYVQTRVLQRGVAYDTSHRRCRASAQERALMGEGDLRFWCQKAKAPCGQQYPLPNNPAGGGSLYHDGRVVTRVDELLRQIEDALARHERASRRKLGIPRILVCRSVHAKVRSLLETPGPFDVSALAAHLRWLQTLLVSASFDF